MLSVSLAIGGIYIVDRSIAQTYDGVTNVIVQQKIASFDQGDDYKYDGYYAVVANQQLSDTLETWLVSPDVVDEIYQRAGISSPTNLNALSNVFDINKEVSQSIKVVMNTSTKEEAEKILNAMIEVMREKVEATIVSYDNRPLFTVTSTQVLVLPHEIDYRVQYGLGVAGGLLIGLLLAYFVYALRDENPKAKKNK